jgi:elongation factor P
MKASAIRRGSVVMHNKVPHRVIDFHHHTPGNLRAMVQTKLRNLLSGTQTEHRFSSTEEVEEADVMTLSATYLYADGDEYHFMYTDSYEQFSITREAVGESIYFLQEQMGVQVTTFESQPIGIELPTSVILTVADTAPELKGATASNSPKPAKTDTGLSVTVPAFVVIGDRIEVSTNDGGKYLRRVD